MKKKRFIARQEKSYDIPVAMDLAVWIVIIALLLIGVVGTLIPLIPGHVLILAGALLHRFAFHEKGVGWTTISILTALLLLGLAVDFISGAVGAKYFGASRWGALGGILGAIVGLFFGLIGIIVGPLLGVLAGELLSGKGFLPAGKSTWGTFLGGLAGSIIKFVVALLMVAVFVGSLLIS